MCYDTAVSDEPALNLVGVELLVDRISPALDFFVSTLGFALVHSGPADDASGEIAVIDAGGVAITLLEPSDEGQQVIADRTPRLTQLVFGLGQDGMDRLFDHISERGVSVARLSDQRFFVPPEVAGGIVGSEIALTFSAVDEGGGAESLD
jgi:catechol 2,3-dioxygenase-like lactoylglutathione lyase family enzyme